MRVIVSFNGVDGSGKTTQLQLLQKKNPDIIETFGGLDSYLPYKNIPETESFEWWFYKSSAEEFCNTMYASIKQREIEIKKSKKPIILIDKGISNFDARIIATLQFKGLSNKTAIEFVQRYKNKYEIEEIENLKIFFSTANTKEERMEVLRKRVISDMNSDMAIPYENYQYIQNDIIEQQIKDDIYNVIDVGVSIEKVEEKIEKLIQKEMLYKIDIVKDVIIYSIGGLSESGKSKMGKYISDKYDIWNLKFKYLNQNICEKYDVKNLLENDDIFTSVLLVEEINKFLKFHYYKNKISLESLHYYRETEILKEIYGDKFKIIFIDTSYKNRVVRTALDDKISIEDASVKVNKKDQQKKKLGADKIKNIADYVINNNGTEVEFTNQLDYIFTDRYNYSGDIKEINDFNIPYEYKETLRQFYDSLKYTMGKNIKLFLVTGSCSRECVIPGRSDIDVILALKKNNQESRKIISDTLKNLKIKIGTTVFSENEIENKEIDCKTAYALYEVQECRLKPCIYDEKFVLPLITKNEVKDLCKKNYPTILHSLRRDLYIGNKKKTKQEKYKIFKSLSHVMRDKLLQEDINATSYQDVFDKFSKKFNLQNFDVNKFISNNNDIDIIKYCNYILDHLDNKNVNFKKIMGKENMKKRKSARAIIIKDNKILLIHRMRENEGKIKEYYVFPGGGLEEGETYEEAVKRECFEELGIIAEPQKKLYYRESQDRQEMFLLCKHIDGQIGTGNGPEFTAKEYSSNGKYLPELINIDKLNDINILIDIKNKILADISKYGSLDNVPDFDLLINDKEKELKDEL